MSGWYRLHRGWQDHPVFRNETYSRRDAFVWLIEHAAYEAGKVRLPLGEITLERGQLAHSLRFMAKAWKWDDAKVRRFLASLREASIIDARTDAGQTLITICKYEVYQAAGKPSDAPRDAELTQQRRGGDAKYKEREEREEETRATARDSGAYAFRGEVVRLSARDLADWRATYHAIPDIIAELSSIDAWYAGHAGEDRKGWFHRAKRMLNAAHQKALGAKAGPASGTASISSIDDAFLRRLERAKQGGNATLGGPRLGAAVPSADASNL